jgi:hypothetical protein
MKVSGVLVAKRQRTPSARKPGMKLYELRPIRAAWRRSTFCASSECAEVARKDNMILLRSSINPRVVVRLTPEEFQALRLGVKAGEFDEF